MSSDFETDPKRDATNSISGYVYQIYQSILAWMQLKETELLVLEGAEDFDVRLGQTVTATQVKNLSDNLTLRSEAIVDSLNNYWAHRKRNPNYKIIFRFLTTAEAGLEHGDPFGSRKKGLEYWENARFPHVDIEPLRRFLLSLRLDPDLLSFIGSASTEELREKLICCISWDMGSRPREALQYEIEDKLKVHGLGLSIHSHYSRQALPHLLKKVADLLSSKEKKELRYGDFISCFDEATTIVIPRGEREAIRGGDSLQQLAAMQDVIEATRLANKTPTLENPIPVVDGGIARTKIVELLTKLLRDQRIIFMHGSSGLGKTNLASLVSQEIGGRWGWVGFRSKKPEQVKDILSRISFDIHALQLPPFLVLDDIDVGQVTYFERELIAIIFSVINKNGMVIVTGPVRPPLHLLPKLWKSAACEVAVPYFDEAEIAEMVRTHGLSEDGRVSAWARTILVTTSGHPQLVHARVRNLSAKGWPQIKFSDLTKPEDVERVREEARNRLVQEFPTDNTRVLAYRLSLIIGAFSRHTALAVAALSPEIRLPGETFEVLVGPWIEREGDDRYRVSPLLTGAANNVLSATEVKGVHEAVAFSFLGRESLNQFEVGTAAYHSFTAKSAPALTKLAHGILTTDSTNLHFLCDAMPWFTEVALDVGQRILPGNPSVDLMLRLAQYKLITSSSKQENVLAIIERIEETLNEIDEGKLRQTSEVMAYSMVLNTLGVQIPSSIVIRMLSRMIDLYDEDGHFKEVADSFSTGQYEVPRLGDNKPAQILFSYQAVRLSGLDDLSDLVAALEALPTTKREHLLKVCDSNIDFAGLLINRAWWKEVRDGKLDVDKALDVFDITAKQSRDWGKLELTKACLVAISVIHDEYGHSTKEALAVLDAADKEFPDEAGLINQRAKVLFRANRNLEALRVANKALKLQGLSDVEYVYTCRSAGISAAKTHDWAEAERYFLMGVEKAKTSSVLQNMRVGLMADAAFTQWKQKKYSACLLLFADVLDSLSVIPISEDIHTRHLHATVRHSISWVHFDSQGEPPEGFVEPLPGMCSNQEPHEGIKDHRIIDISAAWELLASTERTLGLEIGIRDRVQATTGGRKPLVLAGYERTLAFDQTFKSEDFENLIPRLIGMLEGLSLSKTLKESEDAAWEIASIPKLPDGYWGKSENLAWVYHYLLVASVICTAKNSAIPLPIERWRTDLANVGALHDGVNQYLNVLNGLPPDDSLYQQAAAAIFALRSRTLTPTELWKASFRLINALMVEKRFVEPALEGLLIKHWHFAANNQCFAFSTPSLVCPEIERRCLDNTISGLAKVSAVLEISASSLNVRASSEAMEMIKKLSNVK